MQSTLHDYCKTCPAFNPFFTLALVLTGGQDGSTVRSGLSLSHYCCKHSSFSADFRYLWSPAKYQKGKVILAVNMVPGRSQDCQHLLKQLSSWRRSRGMAFNSQNFPTMCHFWKFWEGKSMHLKYTLVTEVVSRPWLNIKLMIFLTLKETGKIY